MQFVKTWGLVVILFALHINSFTGLLSLTMMHWYAFILWTVLVIVELRFCFQLWDYTRLLWSFCFILLREISHSLLRYVLLWNLFSVIIIYWSFSFFLSLEIFLWIPPHFFNFLVQLFLREISFYFCQRIQLLFILSK